MIYLDFFKALVYTAVFSLLATPLDFKLATAIGAIDIPKDSRRMHSMPIPRTGGISIFAAFAVFGFIFCRDIAPELTCLLMGAIFTVILGIADDAFCLSAKIKLTVQVVAALITVSGILFLYGGSGVILSTVAVLWVLIFTNAHNFIDGLDGLCAGVSITEAVALSVIFLLNGDTSLGILAATVGGACIGFFPYNGKKARIFMGDTGSTFLGFSLGAISLVFLLRHMSITAFISICFVFFVPLSDIFFAVSRRLYQRKSIFFPDRHHIHHMLADSTLGHRGASLVLRLVSLVSSIFGVLVISFELR